mmetsp:Transcript_52219/g.123469  ORF Transcript_52219/g.123469 Transcript_52219/m.123469 type:complete len:243 (+) Transcript_52219:1-729(+)
MGLILSKLFRFQNCLFLNTEYYFLQERSQASFNCPDRFYIKTIYKACPKNSFLISLQLKNLDIYKEFNQKNNKYEEQKFKKWIFSRNFLFPPYLGIEKKFVFFSENSPKMESLNLILKGNKISLKNNPNLTYLLTPKNFYIPSLICQFANLSWFFASLTTMNILPTNPFLKVQIPIKALKNFTKNNFLQNKLPVKKKERLLLSGKIFFITEKRFSKFSIIRLKKFFKPEKKKSQKTRLIFFN